MFIGLDFLIDKNQKLYLSEVNTGLPGGAQEYDLVYRQKYNKASGIFKKIEDISFDLYHKCFSEYIHSLPYISSLKKLKVWMDGVGNLPEKFHPQLRLEDKWIQYLILSDSYPIIKTKIFSEKELKNIYDILKKQKLVLKKRYGRGGRGFKVIERMQDLQNIQDPRPSYLYQPYINSSITSGRHDYRLSLRAAAFSGHFICMFANLSSKITSNHGIRTFVTKGKSIKLKDNNFKKIDIVKKAWEADILFGDDVPDHLYENLYREVISDTELLIPDTIYETIIEYSEKISAGYKDIVFSRLPRCYIEDNYD